MGKQFFTFQLGRLAYKAGKSDHWHAGINFSDDSSYRLLIDLLYLGCFYWRDADAGSYRGTPN